MEREPNHDVYIRILRGMSPDQRLAKAIEITERVRALFRQGLRNRFPHLSEEELHKLYLARLAKCHNRNY